MSNRKNNELKKKNEPIKQPVKMTNADYKSMVILTLLFLVMVFIRLGNNYAPSSGMEFKNGGNRDVIIDLGEYTSIDSINVFLGANENRHISLSAYNEVTKEWQVISTDNVIVSVFDWNKIPVNYYLRYLGVVFTDDKAEILELVCKAPDGTIITPVNKDEYPELYDEQDMYPKDVTFLDGTYFDEIYHGRTAYEIVHNINVYETTHPHFGKILISLGIRLFGMNPFGWRFMLALMGTLMVPVMYLFAKKMTDSTFVATATTLLLVCDCMHFGLSRISTIDIPVALFIMLMYYFMYRYLAEPNKESRNAYYMLILSGLFMSFGIATKFTGVYAGIGLAIIFLGYTVMHFPKKSWKKLLGLCTGVFAVAPVLIYTMSFAPVVTCVGAKNIFEKMYIGTKNMVDYHSNLQATHYYSSKWYQWPVDIKPLLESHERLADGRVSCISIMGNPAIMWIIIPCFIFMLYRIFRKKDQKALFLVIAALAQYVPWMLVSRCTFIYHYFPTMLFGMLMIGYTMKLIMEAKPKLKYGVMAYLAVVVILFIVFYPAISGLPVNQAYLMKLKWFKDWVITY